MSTFVVAIIFLLLLGASFLLTAGLTWIVCFAFGFTFTWKAALGVWAIMYLIRWAVNAANAGRK